MAYFGRPAQDLLTRTELFCKVKGEFKVCRAIVCGNAPESARSSPISWEATALARGLFIYCDKQVWLKTHS